MKKFIKFLNSEEEWVPMTACTFNDNNCDHDDYCSKADDVCTLGDDTYCSAYADDGVWI